MAAKNNKGIFRARRVQVEFVNKAKLVDSRVAVNKQTGEQFDVGIFDDPEHGRVEILFPNNWQPFGFDIEFGQAYDCGWQKGDNGNLFTCKPAQ